MLRALGYRKGQAAALAVLAALVTACAVFAPLYDRAMQQSLVDVKLDQATSLDTSLRMQMQAISSDVPGQVPPPSRLVSAVPGNLARDFHPPILGWTATAAPSGATGQVMSRTAACDHIRVVDGRCPSAAGQILVSTKDTEVFGLHVGQTVAVATAATATDGAGAPTQDLEIVGTYDVIPGEHWFSEPLTGWSGTPTDSPPILPRHEMWLTTDATFTTPAPSSQLPDLTSSAEFRLDRTRVGIDELRRLTGLSAITGSPVLRGSTAIPDVQTGLPQIAVAVASQVDDSRVLVPTILLPLGVLCLVVLWLVLVTITDLRRSEVAVARLRGQGVGGARRLVTAELMPAVLLGAVPGTLAAFAGAWLAARALPGDAGVELRPPVLLTVAGIVVLLLATTLLAAVRVARTPLDALVRRSSTVRRGWSLRVFDAIVLAGCGVLAVIFLTGGLDGPAAFVAPALFALVVGLVLAHAMTPLAAAGGRLLLRRRATGPALGLLDAARSPSLRSTITVLTVATALTVFSIDAVLVAARNRDDAARQEAGAPAVLDVASTNLEAVDKALGDVGDPRATPVVTIRPPGADGITTMAVRPDQFAHVALITPGTLPTDWARRISPDGVKPVEMTGRRLSVTVTGGIVSRGVRGDPESATLGVDVVAAQQTFHRDLGAVPTSGTARLTTEVPCEDGCQLAALTLSTTVGSSMNGHATLAKVTLDQRPVDLGVPGDWLRYDDPDGGGLGLSGTDALTLVAGTTGPEEVAVTQAWFRPTVAAIATSATPSDHRAVTIAGIDGKSRPATVAGTATRLPGAPNRTVLADLDVLQRASIPSTDARVAVWLGSADPRLLRRVTQALADQGLSVSGTQTLADVRRGYDESIPTWSVQLGVLAGLAALGVGVLALAVAAVSGWRVRARDLASLWVGGVPRRTVGRLAVSAQVPTIVLAVLAGAVSGLVGATVALPTIPLFADPPEVDTLDLRTPWLAVAAVAVACLVVLTLIGVAAGRAVFRRANLLRLREGS